MKNFISVVILLFCCMTNINTQTVPSYVSTTGLVGWWPFNGNATDESGNGLNGNVIGALLTSDRNSLINKAYDFDHTGAVLFGPQNDEVYIPYGSILNVSNITVSVWVYPRSYYYPGSSFDPRSVIISRAQSSMPWSSAWSIYLTPTSVQGTIFAPSSAWSTTSRTATTPNPISLNAWHHIVMTYDLNNIKMYIDGVQSATEFHNDPMNLSGNSGIQIGEKSGSIAFTQYQNFTDGKIDDIGIWNRALGNSEIQGLYNGTSSININELDNNTSIVFYPNPFTNEIYFNSESDIVNKKYFIYNTSGQLIDKGILNGNKINCSDFSKGLYFIKLEGSTKLVKVIKEN